MVELLPVMDTTEEKIEKLREEIKITPHHKGTEHHIGRLRARIARLEEELVEKHVKKRGGPPAGGFAVRKQGDGTVVLVGYPSVGKSTLLNALTSAKSRVAPYPFTTLMVIPGMMEHQGAKIQILDVPGLVGGAAKGAGKGREVLSVVRASDLLLLMAEAGREEQFEVIQEELHQSGVRLNQKLPPVLIKKKLKGGIKTNFPLAVEIAKELRINNVEIYIKGKTGVDELIDAFLGNRVYIPALYLVNKIDQMPQIKQKPDFIYVSSFLGIGLSQLKEKIWGKLELIRIYLKPKDSDPDFANPLILKKGATCRQAIEKISSELLKQTKSVKVWSSGAKYPGQQVSLSFPLKDTDIVTVET